MLGRDGFTSLASKDSAILSKPLVACLCFTLDAECSVQKGDSVGPESVRHHFTRSRFACLAALKDLE